MPSGGVHVMCTMVNKTGQHTSRDKQLRRNNSNVAEETANFSG